MRFHLKFFVTALLALGSRAAQWPYNRVEGDIQKSGRIVPDKSKPEFEGGQLPNNSFVDWLRDVSHNVTKVNDAFGKANISDNVQWFSDLLDTIEVPDNAENHPITHLPARPNTPQLDARQLFAHLKFPLDPLCTVDKSRWWYRTADGSCNWLKVNESRIGAVGTAKVRDYGQHSYADSISKPRKGPNARAVSNAFFKRKKELYYEHTPLLLGLIEFIMHDVSYSQDSLVEDEYIDVPMPDGEEDFPKDTTMRVRRTASMPGTGTALGNPREVVNMATTWLDLSALYGSTPEVVKALRSFSGGKLLTTETQARGTKNAASYLPFNKMNVPTNTRPNQDPETLFGGGDPRTNEDWMLLGVHTLLLREHNRLCDILARQHPEYNDEELFQTIRLVMSAKYAMIANSYQMAYWTDAMPWPRADGYPLYRQMYGKNSLEINPANTYPWPLVTKKGKPMVVSVEMSVLYRFHEFIISKFPIIDAANNTLWEQDLFSTGFNATGFVDTGLENILRGMVGTHIPNFKSGVDDSFRSAGKYRGRPFDIVAWSIVHEREQGVPTFNQYFTEYNKQDPEVEVKIRKKFTDFSSDPEMVAKLRELYKTPDDVDFVVGAQLDEEFFPGTSVPKSALIVSLFSLFGMGNSDRFSIGFAMMRCMLVDKPWDCHPSNALEELLWVPKEKDGDQEVRFYDTFWLKELDLPAHGANLLWRLITENTEIKCVQRSPLWPVHPQKNPILCSLPEAGVDIGDVSLTVVQIILALIRQHKVELIIFAITIFAVLFWNSRRQKKGIPPTLLGWPVLGKALAFKNDSRAVILEGFHKFQPVLSGSFGIKLGSLTNYLITRPEDLNLMKHDNPYEARFNFHNFMKAINFNLVVGQDNFDSNIHVKLVRQHFSDPDILSGFVSTIEESARDFLRLNPLTPGQQYEGLNDYFNRYVAYVTSRCAVGPRGFDDATLLKTFQKFNDDAIEVMGISSILPKFLSFISSWKIKRDFRTICKKLIHVIEDARNDLLKPDHIVDPAFIYRVLDIIDNDDRASDIIAIGVWGGLVNIQSAFISSVLDIINQPGLQDEVHASLSDALPDRIDPFNHNASSPWNLLRSAVFESIRMAGCTTGPSRLIAERTALRSDTSLSLPKGQAVALSAYYTHRQEYSWGPDAERYVCKRFISEDPPVGDPRFITWGLSGPHMCPGRWFAVEVIQLLAKLLFDKYEFSQERVLADDEKYNYPGGFVTRKEVGITVSLR